LSIGKSGKTSSIHPARPILIGNRPPDIAWNAVAAVRRAAFRFSMPTPEKAGHFSIISKISFHQNFSFHVFCAMNIIYVILSVFQQFAHNLLSLSNIYLS
jgi:hypothetical protein